MLIFFGLGNNDSKYFQTKHNAGRIVLEKIAAKSGLLSFEKKQNFAFTSLNITLEKIYFLYHLGYMNNSGEALAQFCNFFKFDPQELRLVILQDDSDQVVGGLKFMPHTGSAGHHGINSINKYLPNIVKNNAQIWRAKIGIRPENNKLRSETFVLSALSTLELELYDNFAQKISGLLPEFSEYKFEIIQNKLNTRLTSVNS